MKTITRAEWVAALRSGNYQQTTGMLRTEVEYTAFCCLGVACAIAELPTNRYGEWNVDPYHTGGVEVGNYLGETLLPAEIEKMLNLSGDYQNVLARMNDDYGNTFADIADYIETLPEPNE